MKTILYLYSTIDEAHQAFKEFVVHNDSNNTAFIYRYKDLTAEGNGIIRRFATPEMNMQGLEINSVFVDEHVKLSDEEKAMLRSRMR